MAQGNMLLGYARGSVGDVVFARSEGKQVTRARNRNPRNPRTFRQIPQRAKFANAANFFTRGEQNLFKFAFEDKKRGESDFNAFMRHNIKYSVMVSPMASREPTYPAIGNFEMSSGSLRPMQWIAPTAEDQSFSLDLGLEDESINWGMMSRAMMKKYNYKDGDIFTLLYLDAAGSWENNTPMIQPNKRIAVYWSIWSERLDSQSVESLEQKFDNHIYYEDGHIKFSDWYTDDVTGFCALVSRDIPQKLRVTNSSIILNVTATKVLNKCVSTSYVNDVEEAWRALNPSILQGKLVPEE